MSVAAVLGRGEHVQARDDDDIGPVNDHLLLGPVVGEVRIGGRFDQVLARLHVHHEAQQRLAVVRLGKALAVQEAASFELVVRPEKPVGSHQLDTRVLAGRGKQFA